jgi:hypothetical protein
MLLAGNHGKQDREQKIVHQNLFTILHSSWLTKKILISLVHLLELAEVWENDRVLYLASLFHKIANINQEYIVW